MEDSNVNNLNGVPNFGHGLPEAHEKDTPEEVIAPESTDEDVAGDESESDEIESE